MAILWGLLSKLQVHLYTVTTSGIVSRLRDERLMRLQAPLVEMAPVGQITKSSAQLQAFLIAPRAAGAGDRSLAAISDDCTFHVVITDEGQSHVVNTSTRLRDNPAPSLHLDGLKPYSKYSASAQVVCGGDDDGGGDCPRKTYSLATVTFETKQDRPGPIQSLGAKAINPYSAMLIWEPPLFANGLVTRYVVNVYPVKPVEASVNESTISDVVWKPWQVNIPADSLVAPVDSSLSPNTGANGTTPHAVEALVDNLIGGQRYQFTVTAVTEAGAGDPMSMERAALVETPLAPPPRPSFRLEVLQGSVHASDVTVQFNTVLLSAKNGLIRKVAVIVAEVSPVDGKLNEGDETPENSSLLGTGLRATVTKCNVKSPQAQDIK